MQKIFEEYGGVIIAAIAVVALVLVVSLLIGGDGGGWIGDAFHDIVDKFLDSTSNSIDTIG